MSFLRKKKSDEIIGFLVLSKHCRFTYFKNIFVMDKYYLNWDSFCTLVFEALKHSPSKRKPTASKRANTTSESETLSEPPRMEVRGQRTRNISFSDDDGLPSGLLTFCTQSEFNSIWHTRNCFTVSLKGKI